ncbi:MAG: elongation factor P maturation arginine rhamnosyltransferase EarP [Azospira sp.]|jgi:uncharacterized repeat protein (TIGR03837 family)|nr:elongation factor P maturation arginine rhamnosyltransferase EarP [Azospira sp.]
MPDPLHSHPSPVATLQSPPSPCPTPPRAWDIFCTVVDNYGDIGICWRLARQLVAEHGVAVRLWVDEPGTFARLCPEVDAVSERQRVAGVDIRHWRRPFPADVDVADVVIEAFACGLPECYAAAMARRQPAPHWINLEYLSAETWVADCHGLPSPHPRLPLVKHFFIPGFDRKSAGLLRERGLLTYHAAFDAAAWWAANGGAPTAERLRASLFAYENTAIGPLFDAWRQGGRPVFGLLTDSRLLTSAASALGRPLAVGDVSAPDATGSLKLRVLPFLRQEAYDDLLAACDLNFVRGEDSLVRAIWAGKPFVWHIYPQDDDAHRAKLDAFLDRYCAGLTAPAASALRAFWHAWNAGNAAQSGAGNTARSATTHITVEHWLAFAGHLPEIAEHTLAFRDRLAQLPDLAKTLTDFCRHPL